MNRPQLFRTGIKDLLKASLPESFYDSSARDPSPHCHPGTRQNFIDKITSWGSGGPRHPERILWMQGPAGVGKSALAQTCAELLAQQDKLAAAFFFSRPNIRDDPACLFTSISYQIATKSELYNKILDRGIRNDPTLVKKAIRRQFHELLVNPLQELGEGGEMMKGRVVIIDGLDECAGTEAQREIIDIITASILNETTPFRWAFFSRPEVHIVAAFASSHLLPLSLRLELPVSREIDHEILRYLTDELEKIQVEYGLPSSWLSKSVIGTLVNLSAGLFIYAATIIRFLRERNSLGPVDQLKAVVLLATYVAVNGSGHPLAELDLFYILIMQRIPPKILPILKKILLLNVFAPQSYMYKRTYLVINILGISEQQFRTACGPLHSVLSIESQNLEFCHASFSDFLQDQERSKEFCIYSDCLDGLRRDLLERLNDVHANSTGM